MARADFLLFELVIQSNREPFLPKVDPDKVTLVEDGNSSIGVCGLLVGSVVLLQPLPNFFLDLGHGGYEIFGLSTCCECGRFLS